MQDVAYSSCGAEPPSRSNASRHAWRTFDRLKYGWRVPLSSLSFATGERDELIDVPYVNPLDVLKYLIQHHPSVVVGGIPQQEDRIRHLTGFWKAYKDYNPEHPVFSEHHSNLARVIPICWHGDEGRGKKRGQTVVISIEAVLGIFTDWNIKNGKKKCSGCAPSQEGKNMFPAREHEPHSSLDDLIQSQWTTMKGHSFLQHWPVFVLPGPMYKTHKGLLRACLDQLAIHLRQGFFEGVDIPGQGSYFIATVGGKGDLKWHARCANLSRSFEHLGSKNDLLMCHECCAGTSALPFEDVTSDHPCWESTIHTSRPWQEEPRLARIPYDLGRPEKQFHRDVFHLCKVGIYRDFVGSSVLLLCTLGYFGPQGSVPEKLERAHKVFKLFCETTSQTPGLRSFSRAFFNFPNASSFGWTNSKGSDTMLMMKWLQVATVGFTNDLLSPSHLEVINLIRFTAEAGSKFFKVMNNHGLFLTFDCAVSLWEAVRCFIRGYSMLAYKCHADLNFTGFSMKPKLHLLRHQEVECFQKLSSKKCKYYPNPLLWGCEQNEDFIGRSCRLSRRCDSRLLCQRVLQSILLKGDLLHRRWMKVGPQRLGKSSKQKTHSRLRNRLWPKRR